LPANIETAKDKVPKIVSARKQTGISSPELVLQAGAVK
jgi:hypothetical protein